MTQSKIAAIAFASSLLGLAAAPADSSGQVVKKGAPADGCGAIIDVNRTTGLVTARVNATGATYSFRVNEAATLAALQVGNVISAPSAGGQPHRARGEAAGGTTGCGSNLGRNADTRAQGPHACVATGANGKKHYVTCPPGQ